VDDTTFMLQLLSSQGFSVDENEISYISKLLSTIEQAEAVLSDFPDLNKEFPMTIVDKGVLMNE
jgi:hypothetical protein